MHTVGGFTIVASRYGVRPLAAWVSENVPVHSNSERALLIPGMALPRRLQHRGLDPATMDALRVRRLRAQIPLMGKNTSR